MTPALGRSFTPADDEAASSRPVAMISYAFWQHHFAGAPDVIGRTLAINQRVPFTIIGVLPSAFTGPTIGLSFDVAVPLGASPLLDGRDRRGERTRWWLRVIARLAPDESIATAQATLRALQPSLRGATLPNAPAEVQAAYLRDPIEAVDAAGGPGNLRGYYGQPLTALMTVVALVLLVACANIASLLLARADGRRAEVGVRLALGASRGRLVRQFLGESLLLSVLGGAIGLAIATWVGRVLVAELGSAGDPLVLDALVDWRAVAFTVASATGVALLFGTPSALSASRTEPQTALQTRSRGGSQTRGTWSSVIVPAEIALCLVLVAGAGLFVRTFVALAHRDLGFDASRLLIVDVASRKSTKSAATRFSDFGPIIENVRSLPGVTAAAFSAVTPLNGIEWDTELDNPAGRSLSEADRTVYKNLVTGGWFTTYGVPMLAGRDFTPADSVEHPHVIIVNESAARLLFPDEMPIGRTIRESDSDTGPMTIVGVVRNAAYDALRDAPPPTIYEPIAPSPQIKMSVLASGVAPEALAKAIVAAIGGVDAGLTLTMRPLTGDLDACLLRERVLARVSAVFGVLALVLAGLGIYGVVSYAVGQRQREIGIRMALGASRHGVVRLVVWRATVLVGCGLAAGVILSAWASHFVAWELYGVAPGDPPTLAAATVILLLVAALAEVRHETRDLGGFRGLRRRKSLRVNTRFRPYDVVQTDPLASADHACDHRARVSPAASSRQGRQAPHLLVARRNGAHARWAAAADAVSSRRVE